MTVAVNAEPRARWRWWQWWTRERVTLGLAAALAVLARNRFVIAAVAAMAVSFFAYLGLLTIAELSFAVPVTAVTYVLETVLAKYVLKEHVNWLRWVGASLVICGVALVSL